MWMRFENRERRNLGHVECAAEANPLLELVAGLIFSCPRRSDVKVAANRQRCPLAMAASQLKMATPRTVAVSTKTAASVTAISGASRGLAPGSAVSRVVGRSLPAPDRRNRRVPQGCLVAGRKLH